MPVVLPPGRERFETNPAPIGSPLTSMTMGIVRVACWAARRAEGPRATMTCGSPWTNSAAREALQLSPGLAWLEGEVVALDIAEGPEALVEHLAQGGEAGARGENPDAGYRRLRLGRLRRHEQAEGEGDEQCHGAAYHRCLLHARMCGGILRATCEGRKAHFAE
jgi:hypothetical protein